ncbi:MAG: hypothetical protein JW774_01530, partial [Candidatus Aureabacteria bacterium]|nr:hypothetical protein [Candidatus Auribacterota bacterium]
KENNGQSNYTAYLSTDYHNIHGYNPPAYNGEEELIFVSTPLNAGFIYGHYSTTLTLQYTNASGQAQDPAIITTGSPNKICIGSLNQGIQILNWREKLENAG